MIRETKQAEMSQLERKRHGQEGEAESKDNMELTIQNENGENALKIGNVVLPNPFVLAPMAGVTDAPFRALCAEKGAGMVCTEMISAKAISYRNKATFEMMRIFPNEGIVSLQLFGSEPELMGEVAASIEDMNFDVLDVNMGCPVPKVVNNGEGSALMKDPALAGRIMKCMSSAVSKPVTAKIRLGFDADHRNAVEVAKRLEDNGASAVVVHGRTREQFYSGEADWEAIAEVVDALEIPVFGNGDVTDGPSAKRLMQETGCAGVYIGRAARGNPWIFERVNTFFTTGEIMEIPDRREVADMIMRHAASLREFKGEYTAVREMRQHVAWYSAGYPHSTALRRRINEVDSLEAMFEIIESTFK